MASTKKKRTGSAARRKTSRKDLEADTRATWRKALREKGMLDRNGLSDDFSPEDWLDISSRFDTSLVDEDVRRVREIGEVVQHCRLLLEERFLFPDAPSRVVVDPDHDGRAARVLVGRLWKVIEQTGPSPFKPLAAEFERVEEAIEPDGAFYVRYRRRAQPYLSLSPANQRRWRIAFMRYLELCARLKSEHVPTSQRALEDAGDNDGALAEALRMLPFKWSLFDQGALDRLLRVWRVKTAGTKKSEDSLRSKWSMLASVLKAGWECSSSATALEREWRRASR